MFVVLIPFQHCHYLEDWPELEELKTLQSRVHPMQCSLLWLAQVEDDSLAHHAEMER
jgi:hypothetical protein